MAVVVVVEEAVDLVAVVVAALAPVAAVGAVVFAWVAAAAEPCVLLRFAPVHLPFVPHQRFALHQRCVLHPRFVPALPQCGPTWLLE